MVGAEHLLEEDPKGHEWREDPVVPGGLDFFQSLGDALRGEDLGEGELAFLEELLTKEVKLTPKTSLVEVSHRSGSEPVVRVCLLHQSRNADIFLSPLQLQKPRGKSK